MKNKTKTVIILVVFPLPCAPVLVKGICDELGVERDIREAVTIFNPAHNTGPKRTHKNKISAQYTITIINNNKQQQQRDMVEAVPLRDGSV